MKGAAWISRAQWSSASPIAFQPCGLRGAASTARATLRADSASAESRIQSSTVLAPPGEPHSTMAIATAPRGLLPMAASTAGCESASA